MYATEPPVKNVVGVVRSFLQRELGRRLTGATFVALLSLSGCLLLTAPVSLAATAPTSGSEFALPDERAWELVSPPDKHGSALHGIHKVGLVQAAADGRAMTYTAIGPVVAEPQGYQVFNTQILSTRGSAGWSSYNISTPNNESTGLPVGNSNEYEMFSPGLAAGLIQRGGRVPVLSDQVLEETLYLRDTACGLLAFEAACYTPLLSGCPRSANRVRRASKNTPTSRPVRGWSRQPEQRVPLQSRYPGPRPCRR